jgi:hypothetical protein
MIHGPDHGPLVSVKKPLNANVSDGSYAPLQDLWCVFLNQTDYPGIAAAIPARQQKAGGSAPFLPV